MHFAHKSSFEHNQGQRHNQKKSSSAVLDYLLGEGLFGCS
jgi:hypothetical protein